MAEYEVPDDVGNPNRTFELLVEIFDLACYSGVVERLAKALIAPMLHSSAESSSEWVEEVGFDCSLEVAKADGIIKLHGGCYEVEVSAVICRKALSGIRKKLGDQKGSIFSYTN